MNSLSIVLALVLLFSIAASGQESLQETPAVMSLVEIDSLIKRCEKSRSIAITTMLIGTAATIASWAFYPTTTYDTESRGDTLFIKEKTTGSWGAFFSLLGGGLIVGAIGAKDWHSSSKKLSELRTRRSELTIAPYLYEHYAGVTLSFRL